jgi:hypothetical protein
MMRSAIGTYYAVYFDDVASAVAYCHSLVPFIVPRGRMLVSDADRPVVWFTFPPRSTASTTNGCYLFASEGALAAARRGGLDTPLSGRVPRSALPPGAVLLFGEDGPETALPSRFVARRGVSTPGVRPGGPATLRAERVR